MESNTRVALARAPEWTGRTSGKVIDGVAHVRFDKGGTGNFHVDDLLVLDDQQDSKQWPPTVETKTP